MVKQKQITVREETAKRFVDYKRSAGGKLTNDDALNGLMKNTKVKKIESLFVARPSHRGGGR
ncbi:MAG: hypothetical protein PHE17_17945 [Thiothrix sp.]|uniref:hypothetical protein n=1 Tax=Thiothrix sp. TaxID=1032 RepID=UPI00261D7A62|nr:hypothetical protein [Thiothrix sp.]MDD5394903.1 hypothetical protein [Thiothrix sp.]